MRRIAPINACLIASVVWGLPGWLSPAVAQTPVVTPVVHTEESATAPACGDALSMECPPGESPPVPYVSPFAGTLCERPYFLGDLGGARDALLIKGYSLNVSSTQFYQGVTSGGIKEEFAYSGRADYLLNVDGQKAGLWAGSFITLHGETRYGDTVSTSTGAILSPNSGVLFPLPNDSVTALTGVKFTQALSENFVTFGGKLNTLDDLKQPYAAGRGVDAFMNTGLIFPVAAARTVPYSTFGAGFVMLRNAEPFFTAMILDTNNTPTTSGFDSFFDNGATILARLDIPVTLLGKPGHQGFWGTYSNGEYNDLQPTTYFDPASGPTLVRGQDSGSWSLFYSADQALYVDPCNAKRSFGLFTNVGIADNGPSPIRFSANVGLGGSSPLVTRPLDTFGIGYSHVRYSDPVRNFAPRLLPIGDDDAVETFYNYAVTPWFRLTPDFQVVLPARERTLPPGARDIDTSIVVGLRAKIDF